MYWKDWTQRKCCIKVCFLLLWDPYRVGEERRQVLEATKGTQGEEHGAQSTFCLLSFYDMPRPCADPFQHFTSFNPHNTQWGGYYAWPYFTGKQTEAQRAYLTCWVHTSSLQPSQFSPSLWDSRARAVNDWVDDCKLPPLMIVSVTANCNTLCRWKVLFYFNTKLFVLNLL